MPELSLVSQSISICDHSFESAEVEQCIAKATYPVRLDEPHADHTHEDEREPGLWAYEDCYYVEARLGLQASTRKWVTN